MAHYKVIISVSFYTSIWSLLGAYASIHSSDISCLKSIKHSVEDPYNFLKSSWNFNNNSDGFICFFTGVECWHPDENKVLNLRLSQMRLKGMFPRGIENCTSITGLDLSGNEFQGPIPSDIGKMIPFVTSLDLSSNKFSGEIPSSISNCSYLNVLKLDHNRLNGHIPRQIGQLERIKAFSVANNLLSGQVPNFMKINFSVESYANNIGLCGGPLQSCPKSPWKFSWRFDYSFKVGFTIGYAVSLISALVVHASYCVPWPYVRK